jgi:3-hydroxymyristoyl/3-hydroxydecanoyl-(acyl carrier protein) dehydratase
MPQAQLNLNHPRIIAAIQDDTLPGLVELQLHVSADLDCFKGHFPEFPILPGVVQLKWVVDCAKEFLALNRPIKTVERLKFTCPIQPQTSIKLRIQFDASRQCADFRFYDDAQSFAQGRLCYE